VTRWAIVALAVVLLAAPALALGDPYAGGHYVGERDALSNPAVSTMVRWASSFNAAHGVRQCATSSAGSVMMAPDLGSVTAGTVDGSALGCHVWLRYDTVAGATDRDLWYLQTLCTDVAHELAHTGGLSHEQMAARGLPGLWERRCGAITTRYGLLHARWNPLTSFPTTPLKGS
jgi:hypothetical protein